MCAPLLKSVPQNTPAVSTGQKLLFSGHAWTSKSNLNILSEREKRKRKMYQYTSFKEQKFLGKGKSCRAAVMTFNGTLLHGKGGPPNLSHMVKNG